MGCGCMTSGCAVPAGQIWGEQSQTSPQHACGWAPAWEASAAQGLDQTAPKATAHTITARTT